MIKTFSFLLLVIPFTVTNVLAGSARFSWLPNSETDLAGYKILYGPTCEQLDDSVDVGLPETIGGRVYGTVPDIPDGETCFAGLAYDKGGGESAPTEGIKHDPPPGSIKGFAHEIINTESVTININ